MPVQKLYSYEQDEKTVSLYVKKYEGLISSCEVFQEKKTALIGISLGNSYFNEERLRVILSGFSLEFENVVVLLADELAIHNYRVRGYTEQKTKRKLRLESNHAKNRIKKVIEEVEKKHGKKNINFHQWKEVEAFIPYQRSLELLTKHYFNNSDFASEVNTTILKIMSQYISETQTEHMIVEEAKWYLLKELAFVHCAGDFYKSALTISYYSDVPLMRNLLSSTLMEVPDKHVFVMYECKEEV